MVRSPDALGHLYPCIGEGEMSTAHFIVSQTRYCKLVKEMARDVCRYGPVDDYPVGNENGQNHRGWGRRR